MEKRERDGEQSPQDNAASKVARTADGQPPPPPGGVQFQQPVTLVPSPGGYMAIPSGGYVIQAGPGFSSSITVTLTIPFDAKGFIIGKRGAALQQMAQTPGIRKYQLLEDKLTIEAENQDVLSRTVDDVIQKVIKAAKKAVTTPASGAGGPMGGMPGVGVGGVDPSQAPYFGSVIVPEKAVGTVIGKKGVGLEALRGMQGIASVVMGANQQGLQEVQIRGWVQNAVDAALQTINAKIQSYFARAEQQQAAVQFM